MGAYVREKAHLFSQDIIGVTVNSQMFTACPALYFLMVEDGTANGRAPKGIERPGTHTIFAGKGIDTAKRRQLKGLSYQPVIHMKKTDQSVRGGTVTRRPTLTDPAVNSQARNFGSVEFRKARKLTPIMLLHSDLKEAENSGTPEIAVKDLIKNASAEALEVHRDLWWSDLWTSTAFDQDARPWDKIPSLLDCMNTDNTYARVDRSDPAASQWKGKRVTDPVKFDLEDLVDEANLGQGCADVGTPVNLCITTKELFRKGKRQIRSKNVAYYPAGIPEYAQYGFKQEIYRVDNVWFTYDLKCPSGHALFMNLDFWFFATDSKDSFRVTEFKSMCDNGQENGLEADQAHVITDAMSGCERPWGNVAFTACV